MPIGDGGTDEQRSVLTAITLGFLGRADLDVDVRPVGREVGAQPLRRETGQHELREDGQPHEDPDDGEQYATHGAGRYAKCDEAARVCSRVTPRAAVVAVSALAAI